MIDLTGEWVRHSGAVSDWVTLDPPTAFAHKDIAYWGIVYTADDVVTGDGYRLQARVSFSGASIDIGGITVANGRDTFNVQVDQRNGGELLIRSNTDYGTRQIVKTALGTAQNVPYILTVELHGPQMRVSLVNDVTGVQLADEMVTVVFATYTGITRVGVNAYGSVRVDNLTVSQIQTPPPRRVVADA